MEGQRTSDGGCFASVDIVKWAGDYHLGNLLDTCCFGTGDFRHSVLIQHHSSEYVLLHTFDNVR